MAGAQIFLIQKKAAIIRPAQIFHWPNFSAKPKKESKIIGFVSLIKNQLISKSQKSLPPPYGQLLTSLVLGDTEAPICEEMKNDFLKSGVIHLLVASGAQIAIVINLLCLILKFYSAPKIFKFIIVIIFSSFIGLITGFGPSIQRAMLMAQLAHLAQFFNRLPDSLNLLAASGLVILIFNPFCLFDLGFQLSMATCFSLVYLLPFWESKQKTIFPCLFNIFLIAALPAVIIWPLIALNFNEVNLATIPANFLILPWFEFLFILAVFYLMLAAVFEPLTIFLKPLVILGLGILLKIIHLFARLKLNFWLATPPIILVAGYYFLLIFASVFRKNVRLDFRKCFLAAIFLITLAVLLILGTLFKIKNSSHSAEFIFFDVGQADALLIKTPLGKKILVDTGGFQDIFQSNRPKYYSDTLKLLADAGCGQIDFLFISHPDSDHLGGFLAISQRIKIGQIIDSGISSGSQLFKEYSKIIAAQNFKKTTGCSGQQIIVEPDFKIFILYPFSHQNNLVLNNDGLVLKVQYQKFSLLLPGDLKEDAESQLIARNFDLKATVLKISHHGSLTSTSEKFLFKVAPLIGVISVGQNNPFGHPHPKIIERLKKSKMKIFRTDQDGTIVIKSNGRNLKVGTKKNFLDFLTKKNYRRLNNG